MVGCTLRPIRGSCGHQYSFTNSLWYLSRYFFVACSNLDLIRSKIEHPRLLSDVLCRFSLVHCPNRHISTIWAVSLLFCFPTSECKGIWAKDVQYRRIHISRARRDSEQAEERKIKSNATSNKNNAKKWPAYYKKDHKGGWGYWKQIVLLIYSCGAGGT